jgi:hypothetical protein
MAQRDVFVAPKKDITLHVKAKSAECINGGNRAAPIPKFLELFATPSRLAVPPKPISNPYQTLGA